MEIYCLIWSGHNLSEKLRNLLFTEAQKLLQKNIKTKRIKQSWCEGRIKTKKEIQGIGGFYGYVFYADIAWEERQTSVTFISKEVKGDIEMMWTKKYFTPYGEIGMN